MRILHFSDIHFRKSEISTTQDPNFHLRSELVRDVVSQSQRLGPPDAIVISGDIAFAGDPAEFEFATDTHASRTGCRDAAAEKSSGKEAGLERFHSQAESYAARWK